jgi:uncharacterized sulfatase
MDRPNLVLIMTDSQGADFTGAFNPALGRSLGTERIDELASHGTAFDRAYTTAPICTPARSCLFTGIYSQRSGAWANGLPLGQGIRNMGQIFRSLGYRTAYIGKWHLAGHDYFDTGICPDGWEDEYWFDGRRYLETLSPEQRRSWRTAFTEKQFMEAGITADGTWGQRCNVRAESFLKDAGKGDKPFLLVLSYDEPHHPWTCPPEFAGKFRDFTFPNGPSWNEDFSAKPAHYREWQKHPWGGPAPEFSNPAYFGCNSFIDKVIGDAIDLVDRFSGKNTFTIYLSDHGEMHLAHGGLSVKGPSAYDEIARIPLIVRGPGIPAGRRVKTAVSLADILPTMLELAGEKPMPVLDGGSLRPFISGKEDGDRGVIVEYLRYEIDQDGFNNYCPMRAIVTASWKLSLFERHGDELYHTVEDPHELKNLILETASAGVRDGLHDRLLSWMDDRRDPWRGSSWRRRSWRDLGEVAFWSTSRPGRPDGASPSYMDYATWEPTKRS